jgi:hypothetical protein
MPASVRAMESDLTSVFIRDFIDSPLSLENLQIARGGIREAGQVLALNYLIYLKACREHDEGWRNSPRTPKFSGRKD